MPEDQIEELLRRFDPAIAGLAARLRSVVLDVLPDDVDETVDGGDIGYGFGRGYKGLVCVITPHPGHVTLGVAGGASLPDPHGLLRGSGEVHRHVRIGGVDDLDRPGLRDLLVAAAAAKRP
jgi:hypothetical protein